MIISAPEYSERWHSCSKPPNIFELLCVERVRMDSREAGSIDYADDDDDKNIQFGISEEFRNIWRTFRWHKNVLPMKLPSTFVWYEEESICYVMTFVRHLNCTKLHFDDIVCYVEQKREGRVVITKLCLKELPKFSPALVGRQLTTMLCTMHDW